MWTHKKPLPRFVRRSFPLLAATTIAAELNAQAALADLRVMTKDAHSQKAAWLVDNSVDMLKPTGLKNADLTWVAHAMIGSEGYGLLDGLPDLDGYDYCVWKGVDPALHPYGACYHDIEERLSTGLIEWLAAKQARFVLVGGLGHGLLRQTHRIAALPGWKLAGDCQLRRLSGHRAGNRREGVAGNGSGGCIVAFRYGRN